MQEAEEDFKAPESELSSKDQSNQDIQGKVFDFYRVDSMFRKDTPTKS